MFGIASDITIILLQKHPSEAHYKVDFRTIIVNNEVCLQNILIKTSIYHFFNDMGPNRSYHNNSNIVEFCKDMDNNVA